MTNCTENILIRCISLSNTELSKVKAHIASLPWGILLDSAQTGNDDCRWSISSAQPLITLETFDGITSIQQDNLLSTDDSDPLKLLENKRLKLFNQQKIESDIPFLGGALGYFSYELGYQFEKITNANVPSGLKLPEMAIGLYDWALITDHQNQQLSLVVHRCKNDDRELNDLWQTRFDWLNAILTTQTQNAQFSLMSNWQANMDRKSYAQNFEKVQQYILDGDCYQVNLAQRFKASYQGDEYEAYQALFTENRPPFAAFLRLPQQAILSLSPERFIKLDNNIVESKPIKGTMPRFKDKIKDDKSKQALISSEKDRSENLMIVDLLRNDIGRVCKAGTISVPKLFAIESYPAVHHLVSTVLGELENNQSTEDLLRACFPGGSITGAPKIRSMDIIAELEPNQRQVYCGSIGYINTDGKSDTNIAIRTLLCHEGHIYCWVGGGLVADSDVDAEYQECFDKVSKILPCLEKLNK
ncbi:MAG: aminodeoxychorismate synthase component I [Psychromonas sp.]